MPYTNAEKDFDRAKELRTRAKSVPDAGAKRSLIDAATRLDRRGARKASKLGRTSKRKNTVKVG